MNATDEDSSRRYADVALLQAAIEVYDAQLAVEQAQFRATAVRGRPQVRSEVGWTAELRYRGHCYAPKTYRLGPQQYRVVVNGARIDAQIERAGPFESWLTVFGRRFPIVSIVQGRSYRIEVDGVSHQIDRDDGGVLRAPAPAVVVSILVKPGDTVVAGDPLAVLEAMKMETQIVAPFSGKVRQVMTIPNVQVDTGAPLLQIDAVASGDTAMDAERVTFGASLASPASNDNTQALPSSCHQSLYELRQLILGFDVDPKRTAQLVAEWSANCPADSDEITQREDEILNIFVDICSLFRRDPEVNHRASGEEPSAEVHLFSYLRMLETRGQGLPPAFVNALERALAHYGVRSLEHSPALEESLLWIYKSHQRVEQQVSPVLRILERRLQFIHAPSPQAEESLRTLLGRIVSITNGFFPAVTDVAREILYRYFDQPLFEQSRRCVYAELEKNLTYLAAHPDAPDRQEKLRALIECPQPVASLFSGRFAGAAQAMRQLMLEMLVRRYYRIRELTNFQSVAIDGHCYASAEYEYEGKHIHVLSTHADYSRLAEVARTLFPMIETVAPETVAPEKVTPNHESDHEIAIDFSVFHSGSLGDPEATQQEIRTILNQVGFPRPLRRITVTVGSPGHGPGMGGTLHFTYRLVGNTLAGNIYEEEKFFRGVHPLMAKRLHLWRLANFKIERLPSVEDVYLIHGVARDNIKDERLFVCAEVRDATPVRDAAGRIVQLPHLERMLTEALAGIRLFQSRRPVRQRLYWNRILLNVWPPLNIDAR